MRTPSLIAFFSVALLASAQPTVQVLGVTTTQAALSIRAYSGPCTIAVSESPAFSPLHPDVNPSEYPGANIDTSRADTITQSDGTRLLTIGHMNDDRALAAFTTYYWQVSGCGGAVSGSFSTANLGGSSTQQWAVPFNLNNAWNFGYPQENLLNPTPVADPITGVLLMPINTAADWGWRSGCGTSGCSAISYTAFSYWTGGSGWTNPGNILNENSSSATTSNTNTLDVYSPGCCSNPADPWNGISIDDLGIVPWASATNTGSNAQFQLCLFTNPTSGCIGTPITVTATGTFGQIRSGSGDPDQPFPSSFPQAYFTGWGLTAPLGPDHVNVAGASTFCSSGVCTLPPGRLTRAQGGPDPNTGGPSMGHFPATILAGQKIYIAGSSPTCANNLCTVSSLQSAGQVTLIESYSSGSFTITSASEANPMVLTLSGSTPGYVTGAESFVSISGATGTGCSGMNGVQQVQSTGSNTITLYLNGTGCSYTGSSAMLVAGNPYVALLWGVRIQKATSTGSLTVGLAFKQAGARGLLNGGPNEWYTSPAGFTSGDGHYGFLAIGASTVFGAQYMYFVSGDGTVRPVWSTRIPTTPSCFSPAGANGQPASQGFPYINSTISFDPTNPKKFYLAYNNQAGSQSIFAITYTGDAYQCGTGNSCAVPDNYTLSMEGNIPLYSAAEGGGNCDYTSWTNLMVPGSSDLQTQIASYTPAYNSTLYGTNFAFDGISGTTAFFHNNYSGQNNPAWIAVVDLSQNPAKLVDMIHTLDGTGTANASAQIGPAAIRWGGHHNGTPVSAVVNTIQLTEDLLANQNSSVMFSGPFEFTPNAVLESDGITWNTNTALSWPPSSSAYYTTCPGGNPYAAWSYATSPGGPSVTNNCLTLRIPLGGACNISPSSTELANFPACPWNPSYTEPVTLQVGDVFSDPNTIQVCGLGDVGDCEHFRIVQITSDSSWMYLVVMRAAAFDYCAPSSNSALPVYFPGIPGPENGLESTNQLTHLNGWIAVMLPTRLQGCNVEEAYYTYSSGGSTIYELTDNLQGHGGIFPGPTSGSYAVLSYQSARVGASFQSLFALPTTISSLSSPIFQGNVLGIGAGKVQSYVSTPGGIPWMVDSNSMNGNLGLGPELGFNTIGGLTLTSVTGNVYQITPVLNGPPLTNANYKLWPLLGWAGRFLLHEVSGPSSNIALVPWGICYAYNAGECVTGSTEGALYVNVPGAYNSGGCNSGESWLLAPCVIFGFPSGGGFRRQGILGTDVESLGSYLLTYGLTSPGEHYPYTAAIVLPDGSAILLSGHQSQGWGATSWMVMLSSAVTNGQRPYSYTQTNSINRTQSQSVRVQIPAGLSYAEVQFGYSRFIGPNTAPAGNLFCTARADGCNTSGSPFSFESEPRTLTPCAGGCIVNVPITGPDLAYYRIRRSNDGVNWVEEDIQIAMGP